MAVETGPISDERTQKLANLRYALLSDENAEECEETRELLVRRLIAEAFQKINQVHNPDPPLGSRVDGSVS